MRINEMIFVHFHALTKDVIVIFILTIYIARLITDRRISKNINAHNFQVSR